MVAKHPVRAKHRPSCRGLGGGQATSGAPGSGDGQTVGVSPNPQLWRLALDSRGTETNAVKGRRGWLQPRKAPLRPGHSAPGRRNGKAGNTLVFSLRIKARVVPTACKALHRVPVCSSTSSAPTLLLASPCPNHMGLLTALGTHLPQGLCTHCSSCVEGSFPRDALLMPSLTSSRSLLKCHLSVRPFCFPLPQIASLLPSFVLPMLLPADT